MIMMLHQWCVGMNEAVDVITSTEDDTLYASDEEKYNPTGAERGTWMPDPKDILKMFDLLSKQPILELNWKCPGRRLPVSEAESMQVTQEEIQPDAVTAELEDDKLQTQHIPTEFDFDDDMSTSSVQPPMRSAGSGRTPKAQKRVASMEKVFNDFRRQMQENQTPQYGSPKNRLIGSPRSRSHGSTGSPRGPLPKDISFDMGQTPQYISSSNISVPKTIHMIPATLTTLTGTSTTFSISPVNSTVSFLNPSNQSTNITSASVAVITASQTQIPGIVPLQSSAFSAGSSLSYPTSESNISTNRIVNYSVADADRAVNAIASCNDPHMLTSHTSSAGLPLSSPPYSTGIGSSISVVPVSDTEMQTASRTVSISSPMVQSKKFPVTSASNPLHVSYQNLHSFSTSNTEHVHESPMPAKSFTPVTAVSSYSLQSHTLKLVKQDHSTVPSNVSTAMGSSTIASNSDVNVYLPKAVVPSTAHTFSSASTNSEEKHKSPNIQASTVTVSQPSNVSKSPVTSHASLKLTVSKNLLQSPRTINMIKQGSKQTHDSSQPIYRITTIPHADQSSASSLKTSLSSQKLIVPIPGSQKSVSPSQKSSSPNSTRKLSNSPRDNKSDTSVETHRVIQTGPLSIAIKSTAIREGATNTPHSSQ